MATPVKAHAGLRSRETDQSIRHELRAGAGLGRPGLDVPGAGGVDAQNRDGGGFDLRDDGWEGVAQGSTKGEAEDGVYEKVGGADCGGEVCDEGDGEVVELGFEALIG